MTVQPDNIPGELKSIPNWCLWKYEPQGDGLSKPCYQAIEPTERAWPNQPDTWAQFSVALRVFMFGDVGMDGIALAITADLGIVGCDLDHISEWSNDAWSIVRRLDSYTEWSPSGDGYRIFVYGECPPARRRRGRVEMYGDARLFTVTGNTLGIERHLQHRQDAIDDVHADWLGAR